MWFIAREYWSWLLVSALLGAAATAWGTLRRWQPAPLPPPQPAPPPPPAVPDGAFGAGSAAPLDAGAPPGPDYIAKVGAGSRLFHTEQSPSFRRTTAAHWFVSEETAEAVGFFRWDDPERPRRKKSPAR